MAATWTKLVGQTLNLRTIFGAEDPTWRRKTWRYPSRHQGPPSMFASGNFPLTVGFALLIGHELLGGASPVWIANENRATGVTAP